MKEGKKTAGFGLSLVLLANYVLRITGYSSYTPEMSPMKSASAIDALPLKISVVYAMFMSRKASTRLFKASRPNDVPITNVQFANRNKRLVLATIFESGRD